MFFIPGFIVGLITFPGVIAHEIGHRLFCDLAKVPVYDVRYFRLGNPSGYVVHGPVPALRHALLITWGPLILNTALCMAITFASAIAMFVLRTELESWVLLFLVWVGFSIGMHAFPSNEDMQQLSNAVKEVKGKTIFWVFARIAEVLMKIANVLRIVWFDLIYAVGISMILPAIFVGL